MQIEEEKGVKEEKGEEEKGVKEEKGEEEKGVKEEKGVRTLFSPSPTGNGHHDRFLPIIGISIEV
ncbi:MAG: hypothetical protein HKN47_00385 [Pirellulaceae bacterium]|nr:hypothetical protein [Pirellulaceae bacterium]